MAFKGISLLKKLIFNRYFILGALILSAAFLVYKNFQNVSLSSAEITHQTFAAEDIFSKVTLSRKWVLLGEEFSFDERTLTVRAQLNESFLNQNPNPSLSYQVNGTEIVGRLIASESDPGIFTGTLDGAALSAGKHEIVVNVQTESVQAVSQVLSFNVSYPMYVAWTMDWEGYDVPQTYLNQIDLIANTHKLPVTHFYNPRIYTAASIGPARADYLTAWVIARQKSRGDEIGLHLHMFPDLVKAAEVTPRSGPNWGSNSEEGYDVLTSAYTYEETLKMLSWSKKIFAEKGLGTPISFRAGGWFADEETLLAAQDNGFMLDSSGRTKFNTLGILGSKSINSPWDLSVKTQPYHPNVSNQNLKNAPTMSLWEFPNNGADSYAFSQAELYQRFSTNFGTGILDEKKMVNYVSHPHWFNVDYPKVEGLFTKIDKKVFAKDLGPVIYITLEKAHEIWAN